MAASPTSKTAAPAADSAQGTPEALGWQLRAALPPLRLHSVSLYDTEGNVLWLSEGALGPDEHALVLEGSGRLAADVERVSCPGQLDDGRASMTLALRTRGGALRGVALVLAETRAGIERLAAPAPPVRAILERLADLLPAAPDTKAAAAPPAATRAGTPPARPADATPRAAAADAPILCVQPFLKLQSGSKRLFGIVPRLPAHGGRIVPAALDARMTGELIAWLGRHPAAWRTEPSCFTLRLSLEAIQHERFIANTGALIEAQGLPPGTVGFTIAESLCTSHAEAVQRFAAGCATIGCSLLVDGFSFARNALPLLGSPALRVLALDVGFSALATQDKTSQALVVAAVQACKVLGIHCAAVRVESQRLLQTVTALGCDFAQVVSRSEPRPLDSFLRSGGAAPPDGCGLIVG